MPIAEAGPLRMMGTLGFAGMCSGLVLVGVYLATKPTIDRNRAEALQAAIFEVLPGAESRKAFVLEGSKLKELPEGAEAPKGETVYAGYDKSGAMIGFAIPAEGPGFADIIEMIYGVDPKKRKVVGMKVLKDLETPGLGDKIRKDDKFVGAFKDLPVDPKIVAVKGGKSSPNEIDAITGATISSDAVVSIINKGNEKWLEHLPKE
jgi:electron transport complex protein RnfG